MCTIALAPVVFVRVLSVEWLSDQAFTREQLCEMCLGALRGALGPTSEPAG